MKNQHHHDSSPMASTYYLKAWLNSLFIDHSIFRLIWSNFQEVVPSKVYRCNHPTPGRLICLTRQFQIKTVINLRGKRECGSDALSRHTSKQLNLVHLDLPFESRGAPHKDRILNFAEIYKTLEFPVLIHCKSGADRAGLVSALIMLLENYPLGQAKEQLSWKYGHFKYSKTGILDQFFTQYAKETHETVNFLDWVKKSYSETDLKAGFKPKSISSFITDHILHRE